MRIQGADLREKNRINLGELAPLSTPLLMYLEPSNCCNIRCNFCPTADVSLIREVGRPMGIMSWDLFTKIVDDLAQFPQRLKKINIYKDGEPLLNPNFTKMVRYLKNADVAEQIWVKTNGTKLDPDLNQDLADCGLSMIGISIIAPSREGYKIHANSNLSYNLLRENIINLYQVTRKPGSPKLYIKMADVGFSSPEIQKFYTDFEPYCDYIAIENLHGWSRTDLKDFTLGTFPNNFDGLPNHDKIVCPWTLYQLTVNWNGTIQPCNEDWSWTNILGDVNSSSLSEIWNGDQFRKFRIMHLEGRRWTNKACKTCWQVMSQIDDVDNYRESIRERIING